MNYFLMEDLKGLFIAPRNVSNRKKRSSGLSALIEAHYIYFEFKVGHILASKDVVAGI